MSRDPADPNSPVPRPIPPGPIEPYAPGPASLEAVPHGAGSAKLALLDIPAAPVPPWFFCILMIPFGAISGYAGNTLGALLTRGGISITDLAGLVAAGTLPHTFKILWSPVVDLTLTPKWWAFISTLLTAAGIAVLGIWPAEKGSLWPLTVAVFIGSMASTFVGMAADSIMAHCTTGDRKGQAGGWCQAGNLGGAGIGGGLGLFIAQRVPAHWMASCTIGLLVLLCCLPLLWMPPLRRKAEEIQHTVGDLLYATLVDVWRSVREPRGFLALFLCALPVGLGASTGLWAGMAPEWDVNEDTLALVGGVLGGLVSAAGCLVGGFLCDRWSRQGLYVVFGLLVSGCGFSMAALPHTPAMFITIGLSFSFTTGMSWAAYAAFVLEAIGKGAAATKFTAFATLANVPIFYMNLVNGWSAKQWGTDGMLRFEAAMGIAGAISFLTVAWVVYRLWGKRPANAETPIGF